MSTGCPYEVDVGYKYQNGIVGGPTGHFSISILHYRAVAPIGAITAYVFNLVFLLKPVLLLGSTTT